MLNIVSRLLVGLLLVVGALSAFVPGQASKRWFDIYGADMSHLPQRERQEDPRSSPIRPDWMGDYYLRYSLEAEVYLEPTGFNRVFVFAKPFLAMGENCPQQEYTASAAVRPCGSSGVPACTSPITWTCSWQTHKWYIFGDGKDALDRRGTRWQWTAAPAAASTPGDTTQRPDCRNQRKPLVQAFRTNRHPDKPRRTAHPGFWHLARGFWMGPASRT